MGFFAKKNCDICGSKIGLLGNKKLEDGNMCKDCAKKLSMWFSDRREATVSEINDQLRYREENKEKVKNFVPNQRLGADIKILVDNSSRSFLVSFTGDVDDDNPDVIAIDDVNSCFVEVNESKNEIYQIDSEGKQVSYRIRRYEYFYDFWITISVNNPFFDEIKFKLNNYRVEGQSRHQYDIYKDAGDKICEVLTSKKEGLTRASEEEPVFDTPAFCPNCGHPIDQKDAVFCPGCGQRLQA